MPLNRSPRRDGREFAESIDRYGASGPFLVLAVEADFTSSTRRDEALTAQISGQAVLLTIDAANPRYAAGSTAAMHSSHMGVRQ